MKLDARYTLLYIEDEVYLREMVVSFLEDYFSEIYEAGDGREALEIYKDKEPDIIMTDIEMPKMNGLDFCKEIRKKDGTTPIIIMTAYSNTEYLLLATELNLVKYLIKPIEEEALFKALKLCYEKLETKEPSIISLGENFIYDTFNHILTKNGKFIKLTASQSLLLDILIKNRGNPVSYIQLENSIWYDSVMSKEALRCLVRDVRKFTYKGIIKNISKVGYRVNING
jgi:DNA-binding response OmpR family regulator